MDRIAIKAMRPGAKIPTRETEGSAGYDLAAYIDEAVTLQPGDRVLIPTGIAVAIPDSSCAVFIYARSSLGVKYGVIPSNCVGVIDSDYRGEIMVGLHNTFPEAYTIQPGDRIAQMVFQPIYTPLLHEVKELPDTHRGDGGFGSTGKD